jgi:hypothetical protein
VASDEVAIRRAGQRRPAVSRAWSGARARRVIGRAIVYAILIGLS